MVRISLFSQVMTTVHTERDGLILVVPRAPAGKLMECSVARRTQDTKREVPFWTVVANFTGEKKTKNQVVVMAEKQSKLILTAEQTTGEELRVMEIRESQTKVCPGIPTEIRELTFSDVDSKHYDSI